MEIRPLDLDGVFEIIPRKFGDDRGFFSETYNANSLKEAGIELDFVQDNQSYSAAKGVLRGLHYQTPPKAQDKLVRVISGAILDVVVDIRKSSPTFGKWVSLEVSAMKWNQILVPKGFAHGFLTLTQDTEVIYKVTDYYSPAHDRSIRFDDSTIGIEWPSLGTEFQLSEKDRNASLLSDADVFG
ncbi:dTDP-4-dehydrorhamnose 3,5-epimerase [Ochrobactrum sp. MYb15]|uniref:dTDP-4-dehydrorhamnose 3,5-epimerase n=1 Tax=Brucella pituitosa TaxID=571256 RepID=UPI000CFB879C|nr:dTDP-4-dehydrorhamnose 3,5-epimerase [Ochrobactrum sp. MYb19]PRA54451.1 dTDP-4-dehydrorhamnose 3,5-epimerase [Ochrobactrum sp. MYb68]PRA64372.1 dTDP-4-dehydrorhamnose 3,5-epimerase [Ochrobactrum sp. MYb18]PRA75118.1 dTDP-4-dehydrorhamnose 3,5-epimerase [Brucella thiophenivorans]PRA89670.1 dTDP-4-dehydrorhamnose 3,5-epimerase [Ochrobactrum sp. MYb14]PRA96700.1 dTDP-4-dehydrorhamnose 3,5-epimerase [Ochrobactrum sp. MYb15]